MMSEQIRIDSSGNTDILLLDIKNFLKKLETGQLEIEAGQWELHKDLTNVKETIEGIRKLKQDVEEMKMSNTQAMELIRSLQKKLEATKTKAAIHKPRSVSECSEEFEETYRVPTDMQTNAKGYKKRKCHRILSEKIVEITSDVDSTRTEKQGNLSDGEVFLKGQEKDDSTAESKASKSNHEQKARARSSHCHVKKNRKNRKPDGVIMERYLKDSAKYHNRGCSHSSERKKPAANDSIFTSTIRPEAEHATYWDKLSNKNVKSRYRWQTESSDKVSQRESVLPNVFFCPKCPKSFALKGEYSKHQKREHQNAKHKFYCKMCKKFSNRTCRQKDHVSLHFMKTRSNHSKAPAYKCSYCNKANTCPEQLTAHLKRCRVISKSNCKRK